MNQNIKTLQGAAVKFGRLVSTTDQVLAQRLGQIVDIDAITRGRDCDVSATREGTICLWFNYELYEVTPAAPSSPARKEHKMIAVQYSQTSDGKILLMGETLEKPGVIVAKTFDTFNEALEYADNN